VRWLTLSLALATGCVLGPLVTTKPGPPSPPKSTAPAIADAPWRSGESEAAGEEPEERSPPILLRGGRLLVGDGTVVERGHVLMKDGKIVSAGAGDGQPPAGAEIVDVGGKHLSPGLIDTHSHLGVYPVPRADAHLDGNEMTDPIRPGVRAVDAFWVQDPGIQRALAGGVTAIQVLPGSGNLIGGRSVTLKLRHAPSARAMHFKGAPDGLKMACGENPKRVYGERKQAPMTRMGNLALQRDAFMKARQLITEWDEWRRQENLRIEGDRDALAKAKRERAAQKAQLDACREGEEPAAACATTLAAPIEDPKPTEPKLPPKRDVHLETLAAAIEGRVLVHVHCYRSDDMANMIALADEAGFEIRSFHHALEAYKIRRVLAQRQISVSTWADWWGFKLEAYDGIPENLALVAEAGGRAIVHSDSEEGIRRLNQEAAKGMYSGRDAGIDVSEGEAMRWITLNPAWALGVEARAGSLEAGKDADVVVWDRSPFSVYARAERVYVDGRERHRAGAKAEPWSDFEAAP
jgi:imidazolonepropionase-like amidohydrolase